MKGRAQEWAIKQSDLNTKEREGREGGGRKRGEGSAERAKQVVNP